MRCGNENCFTSEIICSCCCYVSPLHEGKAVCRNCSVGTPSKGSYDDDDEKEFDQKPKMSLESSVSRDPSKLSKRLQTDRGTFKVGGATLEKNINRITR